MFPLEELSIASNGLELTTAFLLFLLGLLIAVMQYKVLLVPRAFSIFLYFWQTFACFTYLLYSRHTVSDSVYYYLGIFGGNPNVSIGTTAVSAFHCCLKRTSTSSYGGTFLFFNLISFIDHYVFFCHVFRSIP